MLGLMLSIASDSHRELLDTRSHKSILRAAQAIRNLVINKGKPKIGIICGSGLSKIGDSIKDAEIVPFSSIPGFPTPTVNGHKGNLVFGYLGGKYVVCMQGRFHPYEHDMNLALCAAPVRVMHQLGIQKLIISNAAGGISNNFHVGDLMLIKDHIFMPGLAGFSPLVSHNGNEWGRIFPSTRNQYNYKLRSGRFWFSTFDIILRKKAIEVGKQNGIELKEGIYVMSGGPQYESDAEIAFYRLVGAHALGMSTCHEVVVARQLGVKVLAFSVISNLANSKVKQSHDDVLAATRSVGDVSRKFVEAVIAALP